MKDNFSKQSKLYSKFRPVYPQALYDCILKYTQNLGEAWDCGTGNGQVAKVLCKYFERVEATDISEQQLNEAFQANNINYQCIPAEKTAFPDNTFDLVTVAQAIHWFDFDKFYAEVNRTAKVGAIIAIWGYGTLQVEGQVGELINCFYHNKIHSYWDEERKHIEDSYESIPFPFPEKENHTFSIELRWTLAELEGYLNTWSAVQYYITKNNNNPVTRLMANISKAWDTEEGRIKVAFPVFLMLGKVK